MTKSLKGVCLVSFFSIVMPASFAASAPIPPFSCSVYADWELRSSFDLTEAARASRRAVVALFADAEAGGGPVLDVLFAEVSRNDPAAGWSYPEVAQELLKIDHLDHRSTPCFEMIDHGVNSAAPLFKR